jgi:hypothetical protein
MAVFVHGWRVNGHVGVEAKAKGCAKPSAPVRMMGVLPTLPSERMGVWLIPTSTKAKSKVEQFTTSPAATVCCAVTVRPLPSMARILTVMLLPLSRWNCKRCVPYARQRPRDNLGLHRLSAGGKALDKNDVERSAADGLHSQLLKGDGKSRMGEGKGSCGGGLQAFTVYDGQGELVRTRRQICEMESVILTRS